MTIECAHEDMEIVEETNLCCECADERNLETMDSVWTKWMSWRRGGEKMG
jgi:hypothetical protein